jgi:hypothetical protein
MMACDGGSTSTSSSFLDLPPEIHQRIAQNIDPRICSDPSSLHEYDPGTTVLAYKRSRPNQTLARLTLVCRRLLRIYAPFSTWRSLFIDVESPRSTQLLDEELEPSPSLVRVLKYPETGFYARELLIRYKGFWKKGFVDAFVIGNLVDFDRFLANTPRLETVRCIGSARDWSDHAWLPVQFFASLSSVTSLRYLYLGEFDMDFELSPSFPPLHQVRILRYSPSSSRIILGELLQFCMPNIHTLHITVSQIEITDNEDEDVECVIAGIQVRCHFPSMKMPTPPSLSSVLHKIFFSRSSISETRTG